MSKRVAEKLRRLTKQNESLAIELARMKMLESRAVDEAVQGLKTTIGMLQHELKWASTTLRNTQIDRDALYREVQWTRETVKKHLMAHPISAMLEEKCRA